MLSKIRIALGLTLWVSLLIAVPALAGGWAVITLDEDGSIETEDDRQFSFMDLVTGGLKIKWRELGWKALIQEFMPYTIGAELVEMEAMA